MNVQIAETKSFTRVVTSLTSTSLSTSPWDGRLYSTLLIL